MVEWSGRSDTGRSNKQPDAARKGEFIPAARKILAPGAGRGHNSPLKNMAPPLKILAIQFKYFGDAVLLTPALRALHEHFPNAELHLLVPEEVAPIFQHLPWLNRVWPLPRRRGIGQTRLSHGRCWKIGAISSGTSRCSLALGKCSRMARSAGVSNTASPKYLN